MPQLGRPVAVQRRVEFGISDRVEWTVEGHLDLETEREDPLAEKLVAESVDYRVKASAIYQQKADRNIQAGIYLVGR
jgi:hypothetical protein